MASCTTISMRGPDLRLFLVERISIQKEAHIARRSFLFAVISRCLRLENDGLFLLMFGVLKKTRNYRLGVLYIFTVTPTLRSTPSPQYPPAPSPWTQT